MYDLYFTVRLLEELRHAERAKDPLDRLVHLQACRHYQCLLTASELHRAGLEAAAGRQPSEAGRRKPY